MPSVEGILRKCGQNILPHSHIPRRVPLHPPPLPPPLPPTPSPPPPPQQHPSVHSMFSMYFTVMRAIDFSYCFTNRSWYVWTNNNALMHRKPFCKMLKIPSKLEFTQIFSDGSLFKTGYFLTYYCSGKCALENLQKIRQNRPLTSEIWISDFHTFTIPTLLKHSLTTLTFGHPNSFF